MPVKKVCDNCMFYHDASCSHFWITKPEEQTCDDFRQVSTAYAIFLIQNRMWKYKADLPESKITWISCLKSLPDGDCDILVYVPEDGYVWAAHTMDDEGRCYHECGTYTLRDADYFAYFPKVRSSGE